MVKSVSQSVDPPRQPLVRFIPKSYAVPGQAGFVAGVLDWGRAPGAICHFHFLGADDEWWTRGVLAPCQIFEDGERGRQVARAVSLASHGDPAF